MKIRRWTDNWKDFIYIDLIRLEICWWKNTSQDIYLWPALLYWKAENAKGLKVKFIRYTIDFAHYLKKQ